MKIGKTAKEHTSQKPEYESAMKTIEEYEKEKKNGTLVLRDLDELLREIGIDAQQQP